MSRDYDPIVILTELNSQCGPFLISPHPHCLSPMVGRPKPNLCANPSRGRANLPANPPGSGLATALRFVIGRRNRYRGLHEQANPDNSKTTPQIFGYRFLGAEFQTEGVRGVQ